MSPASVSLICKMDSTVITVTLVCYLTAFSAMFLFSGQSYSIQSPSLISTEKALRFPRILWRSPDSSQDPLTEKQALLRSLQQLELPERSEGSQDPPGTPEIPRVKTGEAHSYLALNHASSLLM